MVWQLLPTISAPMPFQMALDELLFEFQKKDPQTPVLRFYVSSEPWISAGYSFRDPAALSKSGLVLENSKAPVCRRMTGGGCVLHGRDLIFSLIARYSGTGSVSAGNGACPSLSEKGTGTILEKQKWSQSPLSSIRTSYEKIHEGVKMGLESRGLDPKFYGREAALPKGSDCFDFPVTSDLSWKGKKIAGGAQKRSEGVLLHHESVQVPQGIAREELIRAVRQGLEQVFGAEIQDTELNPDIFFKAEQLAKDTGPQTRDRRL
jgi:lipoate-protein ligase A